MGYFEWAEIIGRGDSVEEVGYEENSVHGYVLSLTIINLNHVL